METTSSTVDLLKAATEEKPGDFESAFNNIILDKLRDTVRDKKIEVAKNMYNYTPIEAPEDNEVEDV
jgi:hypothetical protein|tara:strand:- start:43214 stop:43414 length:201 start_codon:yes stop_codon:yes gene_type:complete